MYLVGKLLEVHAQIDFIPIKHIPLYISYRIPLPPLASIQPFY